MHSVRKKKYPWFKNLNLNFSAWAGAEIWIEVLKIKMQDSWSLPLQQVVEEISMFRRNNTRNLLFLPLRSQQMKTDFSDYLKNCLITIICRDVTDTFDGRPVTTTMALSPLNVCLHLLMFLLNSCKLSGVCLYFRTVLKSSSNGILDQEWVPSTTGKQY